MHLHNQYSALQKLCKKDFFHFNYIFRQTIAEQLPSFEDLQFFTTGEIDKSAHPPAIKIPVREMLQSGSEAGVCIEDNLVLRFTSADEPVAAVITGIDRYFVEHVSKDWLEEITNDFTEQFISIKKSGTDLETGFLNSLEFFNTINIRHAADVSSLLFLEVYPRVRTADDAHRYKNRVVRSLATCAGNLLPIYYLGNHLYGMIFSRDYGGRVKKIGEKIISHLRRDGFRSAHIGIRFADGQSSKQAPQASCADLVEQVSMALNTARKKGPYAICDYEQLMHPEKHPLRKPSKSLLSKAQRLWSNCDIFSLVQLQPADGADFERFQGFLTGQTLIVDNQDLYVLLPNTTPVAAKEWFEDFLKKVECSNTLVGISYYPHCSFSKSSTIFNCRKALLHAAFYGPKGVAVFDGVSLNVSGDIYYAEGDLRSAIKEYRSGLLCDKENINLLNSLGVSYADVGRLRDAQGCFEAVLSYDPANFMALYNLGLGAALTGRIEEAIVYFEEADDASSTYPEIADDLNYRLGRLYCLAGKHSQAITILKPLIEKEETPGNNRRALAFLGKSYFALGDHKEAITCLQKGLQFDEFDAESLGLLGYLYLLTREGDEIALSVCRKGVDLAPENQQLKNYLAYALIACGMCEEARETVKRNLTRKAIRQEAQLITTMSYLIEGKRGRARFWLRKLQANKPIPKAFAENVRQINEELNGI